MSTRITISLTERERSALMKLADAELRSDRDQARYLLREALERRGLLKAQQQCAKEAA